MDGATGIIALASPLDYSQQAYYSLIAEASDPDGKTDTANVGVDDNKIREAVDPDVPADPLDGPHPVKPEAQYIDTAGTGVKDT